LDGQAYPNDLLTDNWKKITFNQFHDLAAGSGIAVIYRDAQKDYDQVFDADRNMDDTSLKTLDARIDTRVKGDTPILVFNSMAWPRTETAEVKLQLPEGASHVTLLDSNDHAVPSQVMSEDAATHQFTVLAHVHDVPAMGYAILHAEPASAAAHGVAQDLELHGTAAAYVLANAHLEAFD